MKKKPARTPHDSIRIVIVFCLIVFSLIVISLSIKFVTLLRLSAFDGSHRFTMAIHYGEKKAEIITFEPSSKALARVIVTSSEKLPPPEQILGVPIDGKIFEKKENNEEDVKDKLSSYMFRFGGKRQNITIIDIIRLAFYAGSIPHRDISEHSIAYQENISEIDSLLPEIFYDQAIVDEELEIEVVNAAGVSGLGGRVERLLTNMGATVVAVTTAPVPQESSGIQYFGEESYTLKRLFSIFKYPLKKNENKTISDIIVIIGKDSITSQTF